MRRAVRNLWARSGALVPFPSWGYALPTAAGTMKRLRRLILLIAAFCGLVACATKIAIEDVSIDLPAGWHVERDGASIVSASPNSDMTQLPNLSIQIYRRLRPDQPTECQTEKIREAFFFPNNLKKSTFRARLQADGFTEYAGIAIFEDKGDSTHVAMRVLCSQQRIAYLSIFYEKDEEAMLQHLEKVARSIRWN